MEYAGLFLASFLAKLPLDLLDVRDVYGKEILKVCQNLHLILSLSVIYNYHDNDFICNETLLSAMNAYDKHEFVSLSSM